MGEGILDLTVKTNRKRRRSLLSGWRGRRLFGWSYLVGGLLWRGGLSRSVGGDSPKLLHSVSQSTPSLPFPFLCFFSSSLSLSVDCWCLLTTTLAPPSARAFNCCSVAVTFSVCVCVGDDSCCSWDSSVSTGVTEDVDLRGGIVGVR